jgi:dUTPase
MIDIQSYLDTMVGTGYVLFLQVDDAELSQHPYYKFDSTVLSPENAGFDLLSAETFCGQIGAKATLLKLGVRAMLVDIATKEPVHYWLLPRSSIYKTGHMMANSAGVIDSSYRGILMAPVVCTMVGGLGFTAGERYFQIVAPNMGPIRTAVRVDSLPATLRVEGGFGSTG